MWRNRRRTVLRRRRPRVVQVQLLPCPPFPQQGSRCGRSSTVEPEVVNLFTWVRLPSATPFRGHSSKVEQAVRNGKIGVRVPVLPPDDGIQGVQRLIDAGRMRMPHRETLGLQAWRGTGLALSRGCSSTVEHLPCTQAVSVRLRSLSTISHPAMFRSGDGVSKTLWVGATPTLDANFRAEWMSVIFYRCMESPGKPGISDAEHLPELDQRPS